MKTARLTVATSFALAMLLPAAPCPAIDTPTATPVQDRNLWMCPCPGGMKSMGNAASCEEVCFGSRGSVPSGGGARSGGGGMTPEQQFGMQMMQTMIGALFQPEDPAAAERRREEAERQRQLALQRAEEERRRIEAEHKKLEGELKLSEDRDFEKDGSLKRDSQLVAGDGDIVLRHDAAPQLLRDGSPESGAKGHRIVDCQETGATRARLQSGLPAQKDAIERTAKQLEEARHERAEADKETRKTLEEAALKETKELIEDSLDTTRKTRALLEKISLKSKNGPKAISRINQLLTAIDKSTENLEKLEKSGKAGNAFGQKISKETLTLSQKLAEANKLFVESGVAEEIGEDLAKTAGGPLGALAFRSAKNSIDVWAGLYHVHISATEAAAAEQNLSTMREQVSHVESRIQELDQDLAENCRH